MVTPTERRAVTPLSERTVCRYLGVHRALCRYVSRRPSDAALRAQIRVITVVSFARLRSSMITHVNVR
jgi:hypothetical protein